MNIQKLMNKRFFCARKAESIENLSLFVQDGDHQIHVKNFKPNDSRKIKGRVLLLHGAIENGRIFYPRGRGLAPFLASHGWDCYCADMRGRGKSVPNMKDVNDHGQTESIRETIPALCNFLSLRSQSSSESQSSSPQVLISHSWGGVLFASAMAYTPKLAEQFTCQVHFGTKKQIKEIWSWEYFTQIILGWDFFCMILTKLHGGYLPAKKYKIGGDGETLQSLKASQLWVRSEAWKDMNDGFDYKKAHDELVVSGKGTPPAMHIYSIGDKGINSP